MKTVNIHEVKAHFSRYLEEVEGGEVLVVCRRNVPVAELRAIRRAPNQLRPLGEGGEFRVPDAFFDPLPEDLLEAFSGASE